MVTNEKQSDSGVAAIIPKSGNCVSDLGIIFCPQPSCHFIARVIIDCGGFEHYNTLGCNDLTCGKGDKIAVAEEYLSEVEAILSRRHDNGEDCWTTADRGLLKGAPSRRPQSVIMKFFETWKRGLQKIFKLL